jgi:PEP-CTERM motif
MKNILLASVMLAAIGPAHAVTATFCGPATEGGPGSCEGPSEVKVFLESNKDTTLGLGNPGGQNNLPIIDLKSDSGLLNAELHVANGFATIDPAQGFSDFNGITISIPGFTFTDVVFDAQLTPTSSTIDHFSIDAFTGTHLDGVGSESDKADTDKQFGVVANGGAFTSVNIDSLTGFDEIKHIEISGLAAVVPEPSTWAMLVAGFGLMGLMARRRLARRLA